MARVINVIPGEVAGRERSATALRSGALERNSPREHVLMTRLGLQIPTDLSFEGWQQAGRQISGIVDSSAWWLGDWLVFGKKNYSDRYRRAIRAVGLSYQTLRNYAWVARRFDLNRRRPNLTFQHHAEVASLPFDEQERLLNQAEQSTWNTKQLRIAIRDSRQDGTGNGSAFATTPQLKMPANRLDAWRKAADQLGVEFDNWVLVTLDRAAEEILNQG
jgi:hypothetical protein